MGVSVEKYGRVKQSKRVTRITTLITTNRTVWWNIVK
jgi:hypothetical protein